MVSASAAACLLRSFQSVKTAESLETYLHHITISSLGFSGTQASGRRYPFVVKVQDGPAREQVDYQAVNVYCWEEKAGWSSACVN